MRVSPLKKAPYEPRIAVERASRTATPDRAAAATAADRAPDAAMGPGRRGPHGPTAARAGGQVDARPGAAGQQQSRPTPPCSAAPRLQSPLRGWAPDDSSATAKAPPELPRDSSAPSPARTLATACAAPPLAWPCPLSGTTELLRTTQPHPRYLPLREAPPPPRLLREPAGLKAFFCQVLRSWDPFAECAILQGRPTRSSLPVYTIPFPPLSPQKIWPASHCTFNSCFFLVTLHCGISPNLHAHFSPVHVYFVNAPLPPLSLPFIPW